MKRTALLSRSRRLPSAKSSLSSISKYYDNALESGACRGRAWKGRGIPPEKKPEEYRVSEILKLTEGSLAPVSCVEGGCDPCENAGSCRTRAMWTKLDKLINDFFDGITIADLMIK